MRSKREKKYYNHKPTYKINYRIKALLRYCIINNKESPALESYVGWTMEQFRNRIEQKFKEGMTWDNFGKWHIDHIKPKCSFAYSSENCSQIKSCWCISNLQPLWEKENIAKGNKNE